LCHHAKQGDSLEELAFPKADGPPMIVEGQPDFPFVVVFEDWLEEDPQQHRAIVLSGSSGFSAAVAEDKEIEPASRLSAPRGQAGAESEDGRP
jgi:hypothetical protein